MTPQIGNSNRCQFEAQQVPRRSAKPSRNRPAAAEARRTTRVRQGARESSRWSAASLGAIAGARLVREACQCKRQQSPALCDRLRARPPSGPGRSRRQAAPATGRKSHPLVDWWLAAIPVWRSAESKKSLDFRDLFGILLPDMRHRRCRSVGRRMGTIRWSGAQTLRGPGCPTIWCLD